MGGGGGAGATLQRHFSKLILISLSGTEMVVKYQQGVVCTLALLLISKMSSECSSEDDG